MIKMGIRQKAYYRWEGELKDSSLRWTPIFFNGIKTILKKRRAKLLFGFCSILFLIFLAALYISTKPELKILGKLVNLLESDAAIFYYYYVNSFMFFAMIFLSIFAGSDLISKDMQHNSITLYLSKPLSKIDYLLGKFSIVLFYLLLFTLIPGLILLAAKIILTGKITISIYLLFASVLFPIIYSLFLASTILLASSLSQNGRFVKIIFILIFFVSSPIGGILRATFKSNYFYYFSISHNIRQFGALIFNQKPVFQAPMWPSGVIICLLTLLFTYFVYLRLKRIEV
jgi:ABC-2 type transport system permease protein